MVKEQTQPILQPFSQLENLLPVTTVTLQSKFQCFGDSIGWTNDTKIYQDTNICSQYIFLEVVKPNYQTRTVHILSQFGDLKLDVMIYTGWNEVPNIWTLELIDSRSKGYFLIPKRWEHKIICNFIYIYHWGAPTQRTKRSRGK